MLTLVVPRNRQGPLLLPIQRFPTIRVLVAPPETPAWGLIWRLNLKCCHLSKPSASPEKLECHWAP